MEERLFDDLLLDERLLEERFLELFLLVYFLLGLTVVMEEEGIIGLTEEDIVMGLEEPGDILLSNSAILSFESLPI